MPGFSGSTVYVFVYFQTCSRGHLVHSWCSQPVLNNRLHSGDFLSALAIVTSGNNFGKIALLAQMLHLKFLSAQVFHRIQANYLVPAVDKAWNHHQEEVLAGFVGQEVIVLGN